MDGVEKKERKKNNENMLRQGRRVNDLKSVVEESEGEEMLHSTGRKERQKEWRAFVRGRMTRVLEKERRNGRGNVRRMGKGVKVNVKGGRK